MTELLPWMQDTWDRLQTRTASNNLPHAVLLTGRAGLGKQQFARLLAQSLLCDEPLDGGLPCGKCRGCALNTAGSHPDLSLVMPESDGKQLIGFFTLTSQYAGRKVALVTPAEAMNAAAANSLLKTLEEPPANAVIILVTDRPSVLPATIRSRCQTFHCALPSRPIARHWLSSQLVPGSDADHLLNLCGDAPLAALALGNDTGLEQRAEIFAQFEAVGRQQQDPLQIAESWGKAGAREPLNWLHNWAADMIRLRQAGDGSRIHNEDLRSDLQRLSNTVDLLDLHEWRDAVAQALRLTATAANDQMLVEDVLLGWVKVGNRRGR